ncbi:hypothetical protein DZA28_21030 [Pseudomonas alloputida]|uniref:Uncharacterized protein n=1 Tax=Pseudomonas alloputida TaxID=1940621 RepID=A0ABY3D9E2_9PSED|nr:hypothetical protein [Pseudomonas alloputida]TRZ62292.1 hypothetical protein DZA28_21030 [Pseudomonas alloputida]
MNKSDFAFDTDRYENVIAKYDRGLQSARRRLNDLLNLWPEFVRDYFQNRAVINIGDSANRVTGSILGKEFTLEFGSLVDLEDSFIEAVLWVPAVGSGNAVELGRFLFTVKGAVLSADKEELLGWEDQHQYFNLLAAIFRKVLSTPAVL